MVLGKCCGLELVTAGYIIGWISVICSILLLGTNLLEHLLIFEFTNFNINIPIDILQIFFWLISNRYNDLIDLLLSVFLILGNKQRIPWLLLPWLIKGSIYLGGLTIHWILSFIICIGYSDMHFQRVLCSELCLVLFAYWIWILICSLYQFLQKYKHITDNNVGLTVNYSKNPEYEIDKSHCGTITIDSCELD